MKIFGMGMPELIIILCVVLLIFGPKNLPKLGSALGKTVKSLRDGLGGDAKEAVADEEEEEVEEHRSVKAIEAADDEEEDEQASVPKKRVKKVVKAKA